MAPKTYFKNKKNQCLKLPDLDRIEKRPVSSEKINQRFKNLLFFNERIFSASETLMINLIKLNNAHYEKYKVQSKLIKSNECATIKKEFMVVLKKYRIDQIPYKDLQTLDSFKIMAIHLLNTFDWFLHQTFFILKRILNKCDKNACQLDHLSEYNESICSEIRKYAGVLEYHFFHIDLTIKQGKYLNEKLNNITIDVQLFYDKAMSKHIYSNIAFNDKVKSESLVLHEENAEINKIIIKDEDELNGKSTKYQQKEHVDYLIKDQNFIEIKNFTFNNLKNHQDNVIESSNVTYFFIFLVLPLLITAILGGLYYIYNRFSKRKIKKTSLEQAIKNEQYFLP